MDKKAILYSLDEKITQKQLKELKEIKLNANKEKQFIEFCNKYKIKSQLNLPWFKTKNPPYLIYYIGNLSLLKNKITIGIVGPRKINKFIENYLNKFFEYLKNYKEEILIISGLAEGTDQYAHNLAIKHNIPTCAILGFGIGKALVGKERFLIEKIKDNNGLIISEFKLKQAGTKRTFPQRNRIIAGLSNFLFVPQGGEKSGTLITIDFAIKSNTPVYSCFSSCDDENGYGTNKLINENKIKGIYDFSKFLDEISSKYFKTQQQNNKTNYIHLNKIEKQILEEIKKGNNSLETLNLDLELDEIIETLTKLEIKGIIYEDLGEYFLV